jgi:putative FmdB family regulatory protein
MPIYAYRCEHCGFQQDVLQKLSDPLLVDCPSCGQPTFRKQVTAAGFQLKGSGWYVTDFRDGAKKDAKKADGADAPAAAKDGDGGAAPPATAPASTGAPGEAKPAPAAAPPAAPAKPASGGDAT